jgi:hypothetical protein
MKQVIRLVLVLAAGLGPTVPAQALDDVLGWKNTTWTMTESEVKKSVEALALHLTSLPTSRVQVQGNEVPFKTVVEIDGREYDVIFRFSGATRHLDRVVVRGLDLSREPALKLHGSLLRTLTDKYGAPSEAEAHGTLLAVTRWNFKTTTIAVNMYTDTAAPGHRLTQVTATYAPTPRKTEGREKLMALGLFRLLGEAWRH